MSKNGVGLLQELLNYVTTKRRKRCGRYVEGIEDCISTLSDGDFEKIKKRDEQYDAELQRILKKKKQNKKK